MEGAVCFFVGNLVDGGCNKSQHHIQFSIYVFPKKDLAKPHFYYQLNISKTEIFSGFAKNFASHGGRPDKFFGLNFQILGSVGCQGWVVMPKDVKKSQNHCILMVMPPTSVC
jgi:hypothetical protein